MTERKWTAGPWVVTGNIHRYVDGPDTGYDGEYINHADAHLIAAAPDMYEIIIALGDYIDYNIIPMDLVERVDAAIAKVRGESK